MVTRFRRGATPSRPHLPDPLLALLSSLSAHILKGSEESSSRLGKPQSFVSKYESGERRLDLIELRAICASLGLPLTVLVERFERMIEVNPTDSDLAARVK